MYTAEQMRPIIEKQLKHHLIAHGGSPLAMVMCNLKTVTPDDKDLPKLGIGGINALNSLMAVLEIALKDVNPETFIRQMADELTKSAVDGQEKMRGRGGEVVELIKTVLAATPGMGDYEA